MNANLRMLVVAAGLTACHSSTPAPAPEPEALSSRDIITAVALERTACFGTCPVYSLSISRSGVVRYEGKKFVKTAGADSARISAAVVDSLLSELTAAGYFGFDDRYTSGAPACGLYATDLPSAVTSANDGDRSKRIDHDHGCMDAPKELARLENRIDEAAGTGRWTGR